MRPVTKETTGERINQPIAREDALHQHPTGLTGVLIDFKLWTGAVVIPCALAAVALGWIAEMLGWSRWIGVSVAALVTVAIVAWVIVKRHRCR